MKIPVLLEREQWQQVLAILATAPWNVANPLLMVVGQQIQEAEVAHAANEAARAARAANGQDAVN